MKRIAPWILVVLLVTGWFADRATGWTDMRTATAKQKTWEAFETEELIERRKKSGRSYLPFLKRTTLSMGLYHLPKGALDRQPAHDEDEVYYIESGSAVLRIGNEDRKVRKGSIVYVKKDVPHRFHSITEPLEVLVFFSAAK